MSDTVRGIQQSTVSQKVTVRYYPTRHRFGVYSGTLKRLDDAQAVVTITREQAQQERSDRQESEAMLRSVIESLKREPEPTADPFDDII